MAGLRAEDGFHVVALADQSEIPCRAVIIATGARYQRLAVPDLERFEGNGVYYAATDLEARSCRDSDVMVVGGGNSAGQAAIYLSQQGCRVSIAVRRADLSATMSRYLIDRIEADPRIERPHPRPRSGRSQGDTHLETGDRSSTRPSGDRGRHRLRGAVLLHRRRARHLLARRRRGAGPEGVHPDRPVAAGRTLDHPLFAGRDPLPFETSVPGVFAVGDVRPGSMKRVAAAVGEGSSAVRVRPRLPRPPVGDVTPAPTGTARRAAAYLAAVFCSSAALTSVCC